MGHHPTSAVWEDRGGPKTFGLKKLTDAQCRFLDENIGISRRTLRHVHGMFNEHFEMNITWENFTRLRNDAISAGRCKSTYLKHYYKNENSSERELRLQKPYLTSRLSGGCQYKPNDTSPVCGAPTPGRYCEKHVHAAYHKRSAVSRGLSYIDTSLGKYG